MLMVHGDEDEDDEHDLNEGDDDHEDDDGARLGFLASFTFRMDEMKWW